MKALTLVETLRKRMEVHLDGKVWVLLETPAFDAQGQARVMVREYGSRVVEHLDLQRGERVLAE